MANMLIAWRNWLMPTVSVTPTVTVPAGSGWIDTDLLTGDVLSEMARCPSVDTAKTMLVWDMGDTRAVQIYAAPFHNCGIGDKVRARLATDAAIADVVYDTGWCDVIGRWYEWGALPWGDPHWWDGMPTAEDLDGLCPPWIHVAAAESLGRYVEWSWDVSGNAAGYLDVGRLHVGPVLQPRYNLSYGVRVGRQDKSAYVRSKGGAGFADDVMQYRTAGFELDWLSVAEAFGDLDDMRRRMGVTRPFLWVYNPDDSDALRTRRAFMARFAALNDVSHPRYGQWSVGAALEEAF